MNRQIIIVSAFSLLTAHAAYADTNFNIPPQCMQQATGAASKELATDGDPPTVSIYRFGGSQNDEALSILRIQKDQNDDWYVTFTVPRDNVYTIYTEYTPFLVTYQSETFYAGSTTFLLARPGSTNPQYPTVPYLDVNLGSELPNAYIEFTAENSTVGPLTMQVDANGYIRLYCFTNSLNGQPVTVYDQNHESIGTGLLQSNGTVKPNTWEDAKPDQVQRLSSPPQGSKRADRVGT